MLNHAGSYTESLYLLMGRCIMAGGIYYAGKALYYQRHVSRHVGTV